MYYFTSAPAAYDYAYVTTVAPANLPGWRVIHVADPDKVYAFERFQLPRYGSGLHPAVKVDSPEAIAIGLVYDSTTQDVDLLRSAIKAALPIEGDAYDAAAMILDSTPGLEHFYDIDDVVQAIANKE